MVIVGAGALKNTSGMGVRSGMYVPSLASAVATSFTDFNANLLTLSPLAGYAINDVTTVTGTPSTPGYQQYMSYWQSTVMSNLALNFSKYRVKSLAFHYQPSGNTALDVPFHFCYTQDPNSPAFGIGAYFQTPWTGSTPTPYQPPGPTNMDNTLNYVTFQPWNAWSMKVDHDPTWKYMATPPVYTGVLLYGTYDGATVRETQFGAINVICGDRYTGTGVQGVTHGRIWIDAEIEYADPAPFNGGRPIPYAKTLTVKSESKDEESKTTDDYESLDPPPARFLPNPSSFLGSSGPTSLLPGTAPPRVPSRK
jgi:hypothetical protein